MTKQVKTTKPITNDRELVKFMIEVSKVNPTKIYTYSVVFGKATVYEHNSQPRSCSHGGAEQTYRSQGGFYKDGKIIKPTKGFVKDFNHIPLRD